MAEILWLAVKLRHLEPMIRKLGFAEQCTVRIVCALALLFIGLVHKPPVFYPGSIPSSEFAEYVLPDGTVPVICLTSEDGNAAHDRYDLGSGCEVCRLAASIILPAPADVSGQPISREIAHLVPRRQDAFHRRLFSLNTAPRGPPSSGYRA